MELDGAASGLHNSSRVVEADWSATCCEPYSSEVITKGRNSGTIWVITEGRNADIETAVHAACCVQTQYTLYILYILYTIYVANCCVPVVCTVRLLS